METSASLLMAKEGEDFYSWEMKLGGMEEAKSPQLYTGWAAAGEEKESFSFLLALQLSQGLRALPTLFNWSFHLLIFLEFLGVVK